MTSKTSHVGSLGEFMAWTKAVVQDPKAADGVPRKWFDSEETAAKALAREEALAEVRLEIDLTGADRSAVAVEKKAEA